MQVGADEAIRRQRDQDVTVCGGRATDPSGLSSAYALPSRRVRSSCCASGELGHEEFDAFGVESGAEAATAPERRQSVQAGPHDIGEGVDILICGDRGDRLT